MKLNIKQNVALQVLDAHSYARAVTLKSGDHAWFPRVAPNRWRVVSDAELERLHGLLTAAEPNILATWRAENGRDPTAEEVLELTELDVVSVEPGDDAGVYWVRGTVIDVAVSLDVRLRARESRLMQQLFLPARVDTWGVPALLRAYGDAGAQAIGKKLIEPLKAPYANPLP